MDYTIPVINPTLLTSPKQLSFEELQRTFFKRKGLREGSEDSYRASFKQFGIYLRQRNISIIREQNIQEFKDYLLNKETVRLMKNKLVCKKLAVFTVIAHLSAIKSFFSFLAVRGLHPDVARDVKVPKKTKGFMRDSLTRKQAQELLKSASGNDIIAKRSFAILSILLRCGLRSIEIVRANIGNVTTVSGVSVLYVFGKGRDAADEFVLLSHEAKTAISDYLSLRRSLKAEDPLFVSHGHRKGYDGRLTTRSIRGIVKKHLRAIGLEDERLTCHSLRHTFATLALANNAPLISVQKAMRHANINTTLIYTHILDRLTNGAEGYIDI